MKAKHGRTSLLSVEGEKSTDKDMNHQINNTKGCTMVKSNNTVNFIFLEVYFERFEIGMCVYGRSSVGRHDSTCRQKNRRCSAKRSKTCTNTAKTETKAGGKKTKEKNLRPKARLQRCHLNFNMLKRSLDGTGNMRANIHKAT